MKHVMATKPKSEEQVSRERRDEIVAMKKAGFIPVTQREQRELRRQQRQAEAERAKLTQQDILNKCNSAGSCVATINDIKNAFPNLIHQIDDNAYRTQIDNKGFHEFLLSNKLSFSLPDFVFKKQV